MRNNHGTLLKDTRFWVFFPICGKIHKSFVEYKGIIHLYYIKHHAPNLLTFFPGMTMTVRIVCLEDIFKDINNLYHHLQDKAPILIILILIRSEKTTAS